MPTKVEMKRAQFLQDGVILQRNCLPQSILMDVIEEYALTQPEITEAPKHRPIVVYWLHVEGQQKKMALLEDMPYMGILAQHVADMVRVLADGQLRLLETIIFNKPPGISNILRWHQDVSYFPFDPNNQIAVWIPFDVVMEKSGAMVYALGTHLMDLRASTNLHTGAVFDGEKREPIPEDPSSVGITTKVMEMFPGDMLIHDGRTWHKSGPNTIPGQQRRGLSLRFLVGDTRYTPRPGSAAAFLKQIDIKAGDLIDDPAFPKI